MPGKAVDSEVLALTMRFARADAEADPSPWDGMADEEAIFRSALEGLRPDDREGRREVERMVTGFSPRRWEWTANYFGHQIAAVMFLALLGSPDEQWRAEWLLTVGTKDFKDAIEDEIRESLEVAAGRGPRSRPLTTGAVTPAGITWAVSILGELEVAESFGKSFPDSPKGRQRARRFLGIAKPVGNPGTQRRAVVGERQMRRRLKANGGEPK